MYWTFEDLVLIHTCRKGVVCLDLHAGSLEGEIKGSLHTLFNNESQSMSQRSYGRSFDGQYLNYE